MNRDLNENTPLLDSLPEKVSQWRQSFFRRQLYITTYRMFLKARDEIKNLSSDLLADLGMDSEDEDDAMQDNQCKPMTHWPEFFDVNAVAPIRKSDLKPRPKLNNFKSMESMLQEYNIRDQLEKKMSEFDSQSQGNGVGYQHDEDEENSPRINKGPRSASAGAKNSSNHNDSSSHGILLQEDQDR